MAAATNTINYNRGTTYSVTITYQDNGVAADITGATIRFTVKTTEYDSDVADSSALILKNVTSLSDPTHGIATLTINPEDSQTITPGKYYYDVKIELVTGEIYKLEEGFFIVDGSPTNRQT